MGAVSDYEERDLYHRDGDPRRTEGGRSLGRALLCVVVLPLVFLAVVLVWAWWPT